MAQYSFGEALFEYINKMITLWIKPVLLFFFISHVSLVAEAHYTERGGGEVDIYRDEHDFLGSLASIPPHKQHDSCAQRTDSRAPWLILRAR